MFKPTLQMYTNIHEGLQTIFFTFFIYNKRNILLNWLLYFTSDFTDGCE